MYTEQLNQLEQSIKANSSTVEMGKALARLQKNKDFNLIFTKGLFADEVIRLVMLRQDPTYQSPDKQEKLIKDLDAIAFLNDHFRVIRQASYIAAKSLEVDEATLEELIQEGEI